MVKRRALDDHGRMRPMRLLLGMLALWPALALPAPPAPVGIVTIAEGSATLIRASAKLSVVEGQRVAAEDILGTGTARHLRVEFADGAVLDLGPATQVQIQPRTVRDPARAGARIYLLQGWAKLAAPPSGRSTGTAPLLTSAVLDVQRAGRGTVVAIEGRTVEVFAESGTTTLSDRSPGGGGVTLKEGQFYARGAAADGVVDDAPRPGFIQRVPRPFLDTLPPRAGQFRDSEPASGTGQPLVYADVQPWIDAEPALRGGFVLRWRALARQPEFRAALERNLAAHPEWDRVLHPERYRRKPASTPAPSPRPLQGTPGTTY